MKLIGLYDCTLFECQMIKNLLEHNGIESSIKDEITESRGGAWKPGESVRIVVSDVDFIKAKSIVEAFEKSKKTD